MHLTLEHQGRELLHGIALMLRCRRLPTASQAERRGWARDIRRSRAALEALYAAGLPRNFRPGATNALKRGTKADPIAPPIAACLGRGRA